MISVKHCNAKFLCAGDEDLNYGKVSVHSCFVSRKDRVLHLILVSELNLVGIRIEQVSS
jgi:hypothetical protein